MSTIVVRDSAILRRSFVLVLSGVMLMAACGDDESTGAGDAGQDDGETPEAETDAGEQRFPDIVGVEVHPNGDAYDFEVTISSPYDTPERYADGWRVIGADGEVYDEHELGHDHANEQPFTRTKQGVEIDDEDVDEVTVEGRDQANGYGGETMTVPLPGR